MPNHFSASPAGAIDSSPGRKPWEEDFDKSKQAPEGRKNMAHTFTNLQTHVVFSTKDRVPSLKPELKSRLFAYMGGIIRQLQGKAVTINGTADHVHLLLWMPPALSISETLRILKTNSSRWVNRECGLGGAIAWQAGYGAFSVSHSNAPAVVRYIDAQEKHHKRISFQEEFVQFLKRNGINYDERDFYGNERGDLPPRPGLCLVLSLLFPGLAPWARLCRPCGASAGRAKTLSMPFRASKDIPCRAEMTLTRF